MFVVSAEQSRTLAHLADVVGESQLEVGPVDNAPHTLWVSGGDRHFLVGPHGAFAESQVRHA